MSVHAQVSVKPCACCLGVLCCELGCPEMTRNIQLIVGADAEIQPAAIAYGEHARSPSSARPQLCLEQRGRAIDGSNHAPSDKHM